MKDIADFLAQNWWGLVAPAAVFVAVILAGWLARQLVFRRLRAWAGTTASQIDDIAIQTLHGPSMFWVAILALHLATQSAALPPRATALLATTFLILWIASFTSALARLTGLLLKHKGGALDGALPVTTITQTLAKLFVVSCGLLVLLNTLGISITPILTALGVGGLAVALALQDTLSNLFAGFYISLAGQVRAGDYIRLSTGEEGYVIDTNWRSTTLRALANNLIIVPNSKLGQAILTNYHLPERRLSLPIPVSVGYDCDPDAIEALLVDEANIAIGEVPGLLAVPAPVARFSPGFGAFSLDFTLVCHVAEFADQFPVQHHLRKRIFKRLRSEGIEIPFPATTVYLQNAKPPVDPSMPQHTSTSPR